MEAIGTATRSGFSMKLIEKRVTSKKLNLNGLSSGFHLLNKLRYTHTHDSNSFYPNLLIMCISYLLGMSRRQLNVGMHFIRTWKNCPVTKKLSHFATTLEVCLGSLSIWQNHLRPSFNFLTDESRCCFNISIFLILI